MGYMARNLICTNCGVEFTYNKRGPSPKHPLCPSCEISSAQGLVASKNVKVTANAKKIPPPAAKKESKVQKSEPEQPMEFYYDFVGPPETEKPFEAGEKLYAVPVHYSSEHKKHTRGRVVVFVEYDKDNPNKVWVEVVFRRLGKRNTEITYTFRHRLQRFSRRKVPIIAPLGQDTTILVAEDVM